MADFSSLRIQQGATLEFILQYMTGTLVYAPITAITKSGPAIITAASHGVPDGWPVAVISAGGMKQINAENWPLKDKDWKIATAIDADTLSLNAVNSTDYTTYTSGGYVVYRSPGDLSGCTARGQLRDKIGGALLFADLDSSGNGIVIDSAAKTVKVTISDTQTAAISTKKAALSVELVTGSGKVVRLMQQVGIPVDREVTV